MSAVERKQTMRPLLVTGYSMLSALGMGRQQHLDALRAGKTGLGPSPIPLDFDTATGAVRSELPELPSHLEAWSTRLARMATALLQEIDEPLRRAQPYP